MLKEIVNVKTHLSREKISEDHRSRVSQNFRSAKPFLDRKRPRETVDFDRHFPNKSRDSTPIVSPGSVTSIKRFPLADIAVNTPSLLTLNGVNSVVGGFSSISCVLSDFSGARKNGVPMDISDPYITPIKQLESYNTSESFSTPSLLDDDFDESILQEIDAICEESAAKGVREAQNCSIYEENQQNNNNSCSHPNSSSESVIANEKTDTFHTIQTGSMPNEYSKYLQSLNDKQLEAACSDISTPLLIVAGPGSGKTSTMVGRVLFLLNEGISPSNILAMTFTTAAAAEMRDRIGSIAGKATAKELTISTFHSFSLQLCRSHAEKLERTSEFLIYGHGQQRRAIIEAVRLLENEKSKQNHNACKPGNDSNGMRCLEYFKDKSKKWQKFVTQLSGKVFQTAFRERKIPFNIHGVAFYRKKVVRAIIAMLRTTLSGCDDGPYRRVFKAFLPLEKEEKKRVIDHIDKISTIRKCSFISAAHDVFGAKISGTFKRCQLNQGRKVLLTLEMISKLVHREQSISAVIKSVANMVPQKYLLEQRAVVDFEGGKLLNEDNDLRSVLQYLLDDVTDFLSTKFTTAKEEGNVDENKKGCINVLKAFVDYISERETENFLTRRHDNKNSVTLTTIHQSKGLEWDVVFIVKANETEIPLVHEFNGAVNERGTSVEEERRLLYVAMTRARKKLFILYLMMDANWQLLQPSRFLKEIPHHLQEVQADLSEKDQQTKHENIPEGTAQFTVDLSREEHPSETDLVSNDFLNVQINGAATESSEPLEACDANSFLRRFNVEDRSIVSHLFHQWAKKKAFQEPKRLLNKVHFVIDERLRVRKNKHKDVLRALKSCLSCDEAIHYAEYVLRWEKIPADQRAHMMREKQEHFQKLRIEISMGSSAPTSKQMAFLRSLGCTESPTSRLHASRLIEQYKSL